MAKILPHTQKTVYPSTGSNYTVMPFDIYNFWLGLVVIKGGFDMSYLFPEQSTSSLDGITIRKGDSHFCNDGDPRKRNQFIFNINNQKNIFPYPHESITNFFNGAATEPESSYVCFHQLTNYGSQAQQFIDSQTEWPWPSLYDSYLVNKTLQISFPQDHYIYVADGKVSINGVVKSQNEWVVSGSNKDVTVEPIDGEAVIALLR